jgi:hypothetical protein
MEPLSLHVQGGATGNEQVREGADIGIELEESLRGVEPDEEAQEPRALRLEEGTVTSEVRDTEIAPDDD